MRISYNWLKEYIALDRSVDELRQILTFSGIEVEAVEELEALPETVVSARVITAEKIEGSDHLQVCRVDYGFGETQVVCGAGNCRSGMKCVLALPGTALGDLIIKAAKLRGVESNGMLCSEKELGISDNHDGIIELPEDTETGQPVNSLYDLPDTIFDLEITPNRPDLLGYIGIARDLCASTGAALTLPEPQAIETESDVSDFLSVQVMDHELCPRYTARYLSGLRVAESPLWLKSKLLKSGLRPINNVVDITNLVMLESGHPLHAFDYKCLQDKKIIIRKAKPEEQINALDNKSYTLRASDLVIADAQKPIAIAGVIGGANSHITDNTETVVLESAAFCPGSVRKTSYFHKIQTDSAYRFERHLTPAGVEYASARAAELMTRLCDARLHKGILDDWQNPEKALVLGIRPARFTQIIGYTLDDEAICRYLKSLGLKFLQYGNWKAGAISDLSALDCFHAEQIKQGVTEFTENPDCVHTLYFEIPSARVDLKREIDLIEELARLDGFDKVPVKMSDQFIMDRHAHKCRRQLADLMVEQGLFEIVNYSFDDPKYTELLGFDPAKSIKLINPQSAILSEMRQSLIPQVLKAVAYNLNHDERDVRLFELNKVFSKAGRDACYIEPYHLTAVLSGRARPEHWAEKSAMTGFFQIKGLMESIMQRFRIKSRDVALLPKPYLVKGNGLSYLCEDREIAYFGCLRPEICEHFGIDPIELKQDFWLLDIDVNAVSDLTRNDVMGYNPVSKFPAVSRDLSFIISKGIAYEAIERAIRGAAPELIREVEIFDEFTGNQIPDGFRSVSLHIKLCDEEKTLTILQVEEVLVQVMKELQGSLQVKPR